MQYQTNHGPINVNAPTRDVLESAMREKMRAREGFSLATINLDHLVKMDRDAAFYDAYVQQDIVVADGNPIVWTSRLARKPLELLPGSDLVVPMCEWAAMEGRSVALFGSNEDALSAAANELCIRVKGLRVACMIAPPYGFDPHSDAAEEMLKTIEASGAGLCLLALGAPKQELLAARARKIAPSVGFAGIGASLDFLAGTQTRAPKWVRALAIEWIWRLALNPRRLWKRYFDSGVIMPKLVVQALRAR